MATKKKSPRAKRVHSVVERVDSWRSALSGLGGSRDKRTYSRFVADQMDYYENIDLWRNDDLAGRIVETIPNEMTRQGWELCVEGDKGQQIQSDVKGLLEDVDFDQKMWLGLATERALGGAGVLLGSNDLRDFIEPL